MKKVFTLLFTVIISLNLAAQSPNKISYQAVVRDAVNDLVSNQIVGL